MRSFLMLELFLASKDFQEKFLTVLFLSSSHSKEMLKSYDLRHLKLDMKIMHLSTSGRFTKLQLELMHRFSFNFLEKVISLFLPISDGDQSSKTFILSLYSLYKSFHIFLTANIIRVNMTCRN